MRFPGKRKYGGIHWPHALKQGNAVTCSQLPGKTQSGASFLSDRPMTFPARPCILKPVSSQFQICDGLSARFFSTKKFSKPLNQASKSSFEILTLFFSRGRDFRNFTQGFRLKKEPNHLFPGLLSLKGVVFLSLSRNVLTVLSKDSLDTPKPQVCHYNQPICQLVFFLLC